MTAFRNQPTAPAPDPDLHYASGDLPAPADFKIAFQSLLRSLFSAADAGFGLLRHYAVLVLALAVLGAGLAWAYRLIVATRYEYSMLLQCNGPSRTAFTQVFERLNSAAISDKGIQFAAWTGLPPSTADRIVSIKTSFPEPLPNQNDSTDVTVHRMLVKLSTTEKELNSKLQPLMLQFVKNVPFLRSAKETERATVQEQLLFIDAQLKSLDSLHRSFTAALAKGVASTIKGDGMDAASTYQHAMDLQLEKGRLQTGLVERGEPVSVIVPFYLSKAPMRLLWWVLLGALAGAAVALLIALLQWLKQWSVPS